MTTLQVAQACQVTMRQLQWWDETLLVRPQIDGHRRIWSARDIRLVHLIRQLREKRILPATIAGLLRRLDPAKDGYLVIEGVWVRLGAERGYKSYWRVRRARYCPDRQTALQRAAAADGPVYVVEIGG